MIMTVITHPLLDGKEVTWEKADAEIQGKLKEIQARGGKIVLLSSTVISPTAENIIRNF